MSGDECASWENQKCFAGRAAGVRKSLVSYYDTADMALEWLIASSHQKQTKNRDRKQTFPVGAMMRGVLKTRTTKMLSILATSELSAPELHAQ